MFREARTYDLTVRATTLGWSLSIKVMTCVRICKLVQVYAFVAPEIIGGEKAATPVGELEMVEMSQALGLNDVCYEQVGPDILVSGFLEPIPYQTPVIPLVEETCEIHPLPTPHEKIIAFYKVWDLYGAFSNFSPHPIKMLDENGENVTWPSVEHYYQVVPTVS